MPEWCSSSTAPSATSIPDLKLWTVSCTRTGSTPERPRRHRGQVWHLWRSDGDHRHGDLMVLSDERKRPVGSLPPSKPPTGPAPPRRSVCALEPTSLHCIA